LTANERETRPAVAGWVVFALLLALYFATLAPHVTFWDAGEFIAAVDTWGIPHPPGTPLYVTLGRAVHVLLRGIPTALVVNGLSAVLTAGACASGAWLLARRTGFVVESIAAGICAGCATSVWLSATEAEVYSASLLLSALMLVAAARAADAGRLGTSATALERRTLLVYLFALAAPLHASALVAGPAAIWLCADDGRNDPEHRRARHWQVAVLAAALVAAGALATGRFTLVTAATIVLAALAIAEIIPPTGHARGGGLRALFALTLGATPLLIMLMRARFDPAINQGNPATFHALGDEIARRQYDIAALWPRQAPPWLQLANLFQYADWQFALGIAPETTFSAARLVVSLLFVALGVAGARAHRARDRRSFRALALLIVSASFGVIVYLNLKAGPSIGWGILPDATPHEARDRDYFFTLAFWGCGLWAGYGAIALVRRWLGIRRPRLAFGIGLAAAALPALLNWRAMNRRRQPDALAATLVANALLTSVPPNGVLIVWGDNDSYPLWEAQRARRLRRDVTVVTSPLLGASWYRDELRRRSMLDAGPLAPERTMVARVVESAKAQGRPVAISATVPADIRMASGAAWSLCGAAWTTDTSSCAFAAGDTLARFLAAHPVGRFTDNTARAMLDPLRCPRLAAVAARDSAVADSLAAACNTR
jgi:hypothetical protein